MTDTTNVPTLTTATEAETLGYTPLAWEGSHLRQLAETHDWVSVFWDRGWGDSGQTAELSIIVSGNGQQPKAWLTPDVYRALLDQKVVGPNSLKTFKARRLHNYKVPPPPPKPEVDSRDVAEKVFRGILTAMADKPIRVRFYRGLDPDSPTPRIMEEIVDSGAFNGTWFALALPGDDCAAISAQRRDFLGFNIIGEATVVQYPRTASGEVDVVALAGDEFRAQLAAVIEDKLTAAEQAEADRLTAEADRLGGAR